MPDAIQFGELRDVEIFAVGEWNASTGKVKVTSQMLDNMVRAFHELSDKVTGFRPPLKLGHADAQAFIGQDGGAPALGWVSAIRRVGDKIVADFSDVPSSLIDLIRKRLYNSVSIEFLSKFSYRGQTFQDVLSAVAVLGAELPAVKGLKELSLSLFDATLTDRIVFTERVNEGQIMAGEATFTQAQVDQLVAAAVTTAKTALTADFDAKLAAQKTEFETKLAAETKKVTDANAELKTFKDKAEADGKAAFKTNVENAVNAAITAGKLLPKDKDATIVFGMTLDQTTKIKFSDKLEATPFQKWADDLKAGAQKVKLGEKTSAVNSEQGDKKASVEVQEKAQAKVTAAGGPEKLSMDVAVRQVLAEDPALKERYIAMA